MRSTFRHAAYRGLRLAAMASGIVAILGMLTAPARAGLVLTLQEDNGAVTTVTSANSQGPASFNGTIGDFTIAIDTKGLSNSPGDPTGADLELSNAKITNNSSSAHTLHINVSATGFMTPNSPPALDLVDAVSGTLNNGTVSGTFTGYADASNALFGQAFASQTLSFSVTGRSKFFGADGSVSGFSPGGATYSLSIFSNFNLDGKTAVTVSGGNAQTLTAVPEPSSLIALATAVPMLGLGARRLRRKTTV